MSPAHFHMDIFLVPIKHLEESTSFENRLLCFMLTKLHSYARKQAPLLPYVKNTCSCSGKETHEVLSCS